MLLFSVHSLYGQEEFFQDQPGFNLSLSSGVLGTDWEGMVNSRAYLGHGISAKFKYRIIAGIGTVLTEDT